MPSIPVAEIGCDLKFYPRVNGREDWITVHRYADALKADIRKHFPPVVVVKVVGKKWTYQLMDGKHRTAAYLKAGRDTIPATVERLPQSKWFARSVELNATHGRALDTGDKAWIAKRLEDDGYKIEQVAELLQMRVESLEKIKIDRIVKLTSKAAHGLPIGSRAHRQTDNGHFGFLKAAFVDMQGSASAVDALAAQSPVTGATVLNVLDSCAAVLACGLDMSDAAIVERVERIRRLLPASVLA